MRFAPFIAIFVLPFAGAAALTGTQLGSWAEFSQAYVPADIALKAIIDQLDGSPIQEQKDLATKFREADNILDSAHTGAKNMFLAFGRGDAISKEDHDAALLGTYTALQLTTDLLKRVNDDTSNGSISSQDSSTLLSNINSAVDGIKKAIDVGVGLFGQLVLAPSGV